MAPPPKPQAKPSGPIGYLTRKVKIFGVQVPVWVLFAVGVGGLYLYRKHTAGSSAATVGSSTTAGTGADVGAGGFDTGGGGGDSGGGGSTGSTTPTTPPSGNTTPAVVVIPDSTQTPPPAPAAPTPAAGPAAAPAFEFPTAASTANFAAEASAKSAAAEAAGAAPRFGGVSQVETLASGAVETIYASGRVVEQAPGKSAYVVSQGSSAGATGSQPRPPAAPAPTRTPPAATARNIAVTKAHSLKRPGG